jgi:LysM domain
MVATGEAPVRWLGPRRAGSGRVRLTRRGRVRLTRRGRLAVLILLLIVAGLGVTLAASASRAGTPPGPAPMTVVRPGDTLWSVAERHLPGTEPFTAVEEIRRLNHLADYTIHPGQTLTLPPGR